MDSYKKLFLILATGFAWNLTPLDIANGAQDSQVTLPSSVKAFDSRIVRKVGRLRPEHLGKELEFEVALQMRNYPEVLARVSHGEKVSPEEMESRYLPLPADYEAVVDWAKSQQLTITQTDPHRVTLFVKGTVAQIQTALHTEFAEVTADDGVYISAATAPSVPARLAKAVLGINGLQPHIHPHHMGTQAQSATNPPFLVKEIQRAYGADTLGYNGAGQTIGILIDAFPAKTDLTYFWSYNNIPQSLSNVQFIEAVPGDIDGQSGEETLDTEWTSGIASGANIRVYSTSDLSFVNLDKGLNRIIADLPTQPNLHQLSISLGLEEDETGYSQINTDSALYLLLANGGVSVFVSSGDDGSSPYGYPDASYPASDISVTGVGGTSLYLYASGAINAEKGWTGSGGAMSHHFLRPGWQTGTGVPTGQYRVVPDVASAADPNTGAFVFFQGYGQQIGGTSWSAPTWAGFCALINQARAQNGLGPIGLLNPHIYPLIGSANFRDITSGNNGAYSAGVGYDRVTGIGSPIMKSLLPMLASSGSSNPVITSFGPTAGTPGTPVTISGYDLGLVSQITFNGTVVTSSTINSEASITAIVPAGATTGPIVVSSGTTTGTSASDFTVVNSAPGNDNFSNALAISGSTGNVTGNNEAATKEPGEPQIAGNSGGASVWYSWVAPASGSYTFSTVGSDFDTVLGVFTGSSLSTLQSIAADDPGGNTTSAVTFAATQGVTYYIAIDGNYGAEGLLSLSWSPDSGAPQVTGFTPQSGTVGAQVTITGLDLLSVQTVQFGNAAASFTGTSDTVITATVPAGAITGPITVSGSSGTAATSQNFIFVPPVTNDNFASAAPLSGPTGSVTANNTGATKEPNEPNHAGNAGGKSIWYSWTPSNSGPATFTTFGSTFNTLLAVYSGTSLNALTAVASNDDYGSSVTSSVTFLAQAGVTYFIAVDGYNATTNFANAASGSVVLNWARNNSIPAITGFGPTSGPVGMTIQISGSNFTGVTAVTLNGTSSMTYTVVSDSEIDAIVPAGAATGLLSVSNLLGQVTYSVPFTVTPAPLNDDFANATLLPGQATLHVNGSNVGAGKESGEPSTIAGNSGGATVWWTWTAPATGIFAVSTQGSNFDTLLAVYTGTAVNALTAIASNDDDPAGGVTSYLTFSATAGMTYDIAVAGLNGTAGSISLSLFPQQAITPLYSTGFETKDGFAAGGLITDGTAGWSSDFGGGEGILPGESGFSGQVAYVGYTPPVDPNDPGVFVWKPVDYLPQTQQPVVKFSTDLAIDDSMNGSYDDFQWQLYNKEKHNFFTIDFSNSDLKIYYFLDGRKSAISSGMEFANNKPMHLEVVMDFSRNTWSATLNGALFVNSQKISNGTSPLDFGDMDAVWLIDDPAFPGDNYMVFDNYSVVAEENPLPQITFQPVNQMVTVGNTATFSVVAAGEPPLYYQWLFNGNSIPGATSANLTVANAQTGNVGTYTVNVSNSLGLVKSNKATLTVTPPLVKPFFVTQPASTTIAQGSTLTFAPQVTAYPPPVFQWYFNGNAIAGSTHSSLTLKNVMPAGAGFYSLTASNSQGITSSGTATVTVANSFASLQGSYNGMVHLPSGDPVGSGVFKVTTNGNGSFSGSLILGGQTYRMAGTLTPQGTWQGTVGHTAVGDPIVVQLQLAITGGTHQITGSIVSGSNTEGFTAPRDNYLKTGNPAPYAGSYTMLLTSTAAGMPAGIGYASVTVDTSGNVRAVGVLGDNTPFTIASTLSDSGAWPFYSPLYNSGGFVGGTLTFENVGGANLDGILNWTRPHTSGFGGFTGGFQGQLTAAGYTYTPVSGSPAIPLNGLHKGVITFTSSIVTSGTITGGVAFSTSNALVQTSGPFTIKLTPSTGVFTGSLSAGFSSPSPFGGVLVQSQNAGFGYFQTPTISGQVQITPAP